MTTDTATAVHPWDEGAQEPSSNQIVVSAVIACVWLGLGVSPLIPMGLIVNIFRLSSLTGANTWGGRFRFGKKAVFASVFGSALGFFMKTGLFFGKGAVAFHLF